MIIDEIEELWEQRPFVPIEFTLSDGTVVRVEHPKYMLLTPDGRTLHCVFRNGPSRRIVVDHITNIRLLEEAAPATAPGDRN